MTTPKRIALAAAFLAVLAAVAAGVLATRRHPHATVARKDPRGPVALPVADVPPEPAIWIDVHAPGKAWKALRANAWVGRAMSDPLGQGLASGWSGFLATRGGDLSGAFEGALLDVFTTRLLADPFRVIFFSGATATGSPAFVVARPSAAAESAFELLDGLARNGSLTATHCPGATPPTTTPSIALPGGADGSARATAERQPPPALTVSRWLVAEHAVFAARRDGRIVLSKNPIAVLQAVCAGPPEVPAAQGIDLSVSFARDALGREAQLGASLLGLGPAPRLAFAIEGDRLEPKGILGDLGEPDRLDRAAPGEQLLRLVPADAGVVLLATLRLPEHLTADSLRAHLERRYRGAYAARSVALVWNPRGADRLPTEVAVVWPDRDAALLREAFSGPNRMERRHACGHEVYASTGALAQAMQRGCDRAAPSLLDAAPPVAQGLRAPASFAVGANVGGLLSRVLADAWSEERANRNRVSPDVEAARRILEELPFLGLSGVADGRVLVPGGFRS